MIFVFGCNGGPGKTDTLTTQNKAKNNPDNSNAVSDSVKKSNTGSKKNANDTFKLLQGKWQHIDDKSNFLVFDGNHRKEIADGMVTWDDEIFTLSDKCANPADKDNETDPENDRYISCAASNLCWYILNIDKDNLSLSYMGRGNTLTYKRVR